CCPRRRVEDLRSAWSRDEKRRAVGTEFDTHRFTIDPALLNALGAIPNDNSDMLHGRSDQFPLLISRSVKDRHTADEWFPDEATAEGVPNLCARLAAREEPAPHCARC